MGATQAESGDRLSHDRPSHGCAADLLPSRRQPVTETDGGHGADSIKLSASSHRAIFWNPSTQKKKCEPLQRRRVTQTGRRGSSSSSKTRRDAARRDETVQTLHAGRQAASLTVALSTARLLTFVIRVQILRHCVRQSTTHYSSARHISITASGRCLARRAGLHHAVTPVLPSRSVSDCCTGTHEAVVRDCSQHYPRRYQQYRRAKRPRSARVVRAADRTCDQQRARHPGAEPCTHRPNAAAAHHGATSGRGQWAGR